MLWYMSIDYWSLANHTSYDMWVSHGIRVSRKENNDECHMIMQLKQHFKFHKVSMPY